MQQIKNQSLGRRGVTGRLGAYLAAVAGAGAVGSTAEAGVVTIDVSAINGANGGVASGGSQEVSNFTPGGGNLYLTNGYGLFGVRGIAFQGTNNSGGIAVLNSGDAKPMSFAAGASISAASLSGTQEFTEAYATSAFRTNIATSPDFGPGQYLGFKDSKGRYGYIEVTWTSLTQTFQILSAAYESTAGVAIVTPLAAVPEPSTLGLMALGAAGLLAARARKSRAEASTEPSTN